MRLPPISFFSNSVNKNYFTLNASADLSALWVIFAELLCNPQSCAIVLFVSKLPKHDTQPCNKLSANIPSLGLLSARAGVSSLLVVLCNLYLYRTCSVKRIGGSCEAPAYFFFSNSVNKNYDCSRGVAELSASLV